MFRVYSTFSLFQEIKKHKNYIKSKDWLEEYLKTPLLLLLLEEEKNVE